MGIPLGCSSCLATMPLARFLFLSWFAACVAANGSIQLRGSAHASTPAEAPMEKLRATQWWGGFDSNEALRASQLENGVAPSETMDLAESETMDLADSETMDLADSETTNLAEGGGAGGRGGRGGRRGHGGRRSRGGGRRRVCLRYFFLFCVHYR